MPGGTVTAGLNFFDDSSERVVMVGTLQPYIRKYDNQQIAIEDIRGQEEKFSLDKTGFCATKVESPHFPPKDDADVKEWLYPESEEIIKKATGATRVIIASHLLRQRPYNDVQKLIDNPEAAGTDKLAAVVPARNVHVDHSETGSIGLLFDNVPHDEASRLSKTRWGVINIWRPCEVVPKDPLAVMDGRTVKTDDFVEQHTTFPSQTYARYSATSKGLNVVHVRHHADQKFYYLSDMRPDEALMFKIYDSSRKVESRWAPHSAFVDPRTADSDGVRKSLETRCLVFWEDQTNN